MARISDLIETLIKDMIEANGGTYETTRGELAGQARCVPSQVTYVLTTRFTNDHGYLVESRRGGGGWIRVSRVSLSEPTQYLMHALTHMGDALSQHEADVMIRNFEDYQAIGDNEARLLRAAVCARTWTQIDSDRRDLIRMDVFKNMLTSLLVE